MASLIAMLVMTRGTTVQISPTAIASTIGTGSRSRHATLCRELNFRLRHCSAGFESVTARPSPSIAEGDAAFPKGNNGPVLVKEALTTAVSRCGSRENRASARPLQGPDRNFQIGAAVGFRRRQP